MEPSPASGSWSRAAYSSIGWRLAAESRRGIRFTKNNSMNALIAIALKHRMLMVGLLVLVFAGGLFAFRQLNIEAYPDPTPPMVTIITQSQGLSAEEIE